MPVYLGLDASTQSLTATMIDVEGERRALIDEWSLEYDELSSYGTEHGVLRSADPAFVTAPPLLWVDALDRVIAHMAAAWPLEMARLAAVSGSAQQHGSVYLTEHGFRRLTSLDPGEPLTVQLTDAFSRARSPVWMDSAPQRNAANSNTRLAVPLFLRGAPDPTPSSGSRGRRFAPFSSAIRRATRIRNESTSSHLSTRHCSPVWMRLSITATARV